MPWSRLEVEAIVEDYFSMLASELSGTPYNKSVHRRALQARLDNRSEPSVEFKHANISAVLLQAGFPYISGYKPRGNFQALLAEVVLERLNGAHTLKELATADADRPMTVPEVDDILAVLSGRPALTPGWPVIAEALPIPIGLTTNYIEREARNQSLGNAGELFAINYERARLLSVGEDRLATQIEHTSRVRGDHEGYDILSFEENGAERLIEVKTTKYGGETPFFVTHNEVATSERRSAHYQLYRLYSFRESPRLYTIPGAIPISCILAPANYLAFPR